MMIFVFDRVENIVRKGESAGNPFQNKPLFLCVCSTNLLKTLWEKEKLLASNNSSFFKSVFLPLGEVSAILIKFEIVCKLFDFESLEFVIWERIRNGW